MSMMVVVDPTLEAKTRLRCPRAGGLRAWVSFTGDAVIVAGVARIVVLADFLFTATAVIVQPITGLLLAWHVGYSIWDGWIALSIALYFFTGAFWIPVVFIQMRMRDLAAEAARLGTPLPAAYHRLFWIWFALGFPAFGAVAAIFWLMIARPAVW
jgi:uncharacterized membrane protein